MSSNNGKSPTLMEDRMEKKPPREIIFPPLPAMVKPNGTYPLPNEDDEMLTDNFDSRLENAFNVICNVAYVLPIEFDMVNDVKKEEDNELVEESSNHKPLCYYVMNNSCVNEDKTIFERPDLGMQQNLKPNFIWANVENVGVNKVLVDGGVKINLMPHSLLNNIRKYDTDLRPHNLVLSNYEGKTTKTL